jgi:hypothetical protein
MTGCIVTRTQQFRLLRTSPFHFLVSLQFNNICVTSSSPKLRKRIPLWNSVPVPRNFKISGSNHIILTLAFLVNVKRREVVVFHVVTRATAHYMAVYHVDLPTISTSGQMPLWENCWQNVVCPQIACGTHRLWDVPRPLDMQGWPLPERVWRARHMLEGYWA